MSSISRKYNTVGLQYDTRSLLANEIVLWSTFQRLWSLSSSTEVLSIFVTLVHSSTNKSWTQW